MVVSHKYQFVYSVIPKCGSRSIREAIAPYIDIGWPKENTTPQHLPLNKVFESDQYGKWFHSYESFTVVRNPYDRIYSAFQQDLYASQNYPKWIKYKAPLLESCNNDFNEYVLKFLGKSNLLEDWMWIAFCPMKEFYQHENFKVNRVFKLENLESCTRYLKSKLHKEIRISDTSNVRSENTLALRHLEHYNDTSLQIINEVYKEDFKIFDYPILSRLSEATHVALE